MSIIVRDRRATRWGTLAARKIRDEDKSENVREDSTSQTIWATVLWNISASLAFGTPFSYLKRITIVVRSLVSDYLLCVMITNMARQDRLDAIDSLRWRTLIKDLCKEWTDSNLLVSYLFFDPLYCC
jgi:hypothetical protein